MRQPRRVSIATVFCEAAVRLAGVCGNSTFEARRGSVVIWQASKNNDDLLGPSQPRLSISSEYAAWCVAGEDLVAHKKGTERANICPRISLALLLGLALADWAVSVSAVLASESALALGTATATPMATVTAWLVMETA
jgi:hypothetical protein